MPGTGAKAGWISYTPAPSPARPASASRNSRVGHAAVSGTTRAPQHEAFKLQHIWKTSASSCLGSTCAPPLPGPGLSCGDAGNKPQTAHRPWSCAPRGQAGRTRQHRAGGTGARLPASRLRLSLYALGINYFPGSSCVQFTRFIFLLKPFLQFLFFFLLFSVTSWILLRDGQFINDSS